MILREKNLFWINEYNKLNSKTPFSYIDIKEAKGTNLQKESQNRLSKRCIAKSKVWCITHQSQQAFHLNDVHKNYGGRYQTKKWHETGKTGIGFTGTNHIYLHMLHTTKHVHSDFKIYPVWYCTSGFRLFSGRYIAVSFHHFVSQSFDSISLIPIQASASDLPPLSLTVIHISNTRIYSLLPWMSFVFW